MAASSASMPGSDDAAAAAAGVGMMAPSSSAGAASDSDAQLRAIAQVRSGSTGGRMDRLGG